MPDTGNSNAITARSARRQARRRIQCLAPPIDIDVPHYALRRKCENRNVEVSGVDNTLHEDMVERSVTAAASHANTRDLTIWHHAICYRRYSWLALCRQCDCVRPLMCAKRGYIVGNRGRFGNNNVKLCGGWWLHPLEIGLPLNLGWFAVLHCGLVSPTAHTRYRRQIEIGVPTGVHDSCIFYGAIGFNLEADLRCPLRVYLQGGLRIHLGTNMGGAGWLWPACGRMHREQSRERRKDKCEMQMPH